MKTEVMDTTEKEMSGLQLRFEKVVSLFGRNGFHPKNLLDIGCGNGTVTKKIREVLHLDVVDGVDGLADQISSPSWLRLVQMDIDEEDLPYPDNSFEAIYCGEVIEHLLDPDHLLDEIYRVLSPTGQCLLTTPNLATWVNRIVLLLGFQPFTTSVSLRYEDAGKFKVVTLQGHRGHLRIFTLGALKELLRLHQFRIVRVEGWEVGPMGTYSYSNYLGWIVRPLDRFFALFPSLAYRIAVVIEKEEL